MIKRWFVLLLALIASTNVAVLLDIPILRQILGTVFLAIIPGLLILLFFKLNRLGIAERLTLTVGLSVVFLMLAGWLVNQVSLSVGYAIPLSTTFLILWLSLVLIILLGVAYIRNKEAFSSNPLHFQLNTKGKILLLLPSIFPLFGILGMYLLNTTGSNTLLLFFLCLIPISIIMITLFRHEIASDTYPLALVLITVSLLVMFWLRSEHILGHDAHTEYYFFNTTLLNQHWSILEHTSLDACLSISLLPAIYQSILELNGAEDTFKGIYAVLCAFAPLSVYIIAKRYVGELNAFLAALFFTFQISFLQAPGSPRTNLALLFFAIFIMILLHPKILGIEKRGLLVIFMMATVISHYSSTYVFFFLIFFASLLGLLIKKYVPQRSITLMWVGLLSVLIFIWYAQVTETPFGSGVTFIQATVKNLAQFFILESRGKQAELILGVGVGGKILDFIYLVTIWFSYAFIATGIIGTLMNHRSMITGSHNANPRPGILVTRFDREYFLLALVCCGILVGSVVTPHISRYAPTRVYPQMLVILSPFFILGGLLIARLFKKGAQWIVLLLLIFYFLFVTGAIYEIFGTHASLLHSQPMASILSLEAPAADYEVIREQETLATQWLKNNMEDKSLIFAAGYHAKNRLVSQGRISPSMINYRAFSNDEQMDGYIYLNHNNVVNGKLWFMGQSFESSDYLDTLDKKDKLYDNGGSEVWK
jgi:uncharacterized membrane protein